MKLKWIKLFSALASFAIAAPGVSHAVTVFQSVPTFDAPQDLLWCSPCGGRYATFDHFTLGNSYTISGITFGSYLSPLYFPTDVTIRIFTLGGTQLFSETFTPPEMTSTILMPGVNNVTNNTAVTTVSPSGLFLTAGSYLISFYNPDRYVGAYYKSGANLGFQTESFGSPDPNATVIARDFTIGFSLDAAGASPVPGPVAGAGIPGLIAAFGGLLALPRRRTTLAAQR